MWDHTVFHVVPNWRASPEIVAPSKRNCRIAQRTARTPKRTRGAHTFSLRSRNVTVSQACSRHIQRRIVPPDPRRDPGPGRVDHLHHHTPVALSDHPTTRAPRQLVARLNIEHQSIWGASHAHQMEALQTDEQITPITTIKRHGAAAGRVRHCRGPLKIAGVEVRSSSRTSTSTRNPRPTPGHPHSTRKSRYCAPGKAHFRRGCPRLASRPPCRGLGSRRPDQVAGRRGNPTRRAVLQALFRIGVGNRSFGQVGNLPQ